MTLLKTFKDEKIRFILVAASLVSAIIAFVLYGVSQGLMNAKISTLMLIVFILILALDAVVMIFNDFNSYMLIASSALGLLELGLFISSQLGNLGYFFAGISDIGYGIMPTFVVGFIFSLISVIASSVAVFVSKNNKKEN